MRAKQPGETVKQYLQYQIRELTADRDKWKERCMRLIERYGSREKWVLDHLTTDEHKHDEHCVYDLFTGNKHGFDFARAIQKEIDDDAK